MMHNCASVGEKTLIIIKMHSMYLKKPQEIQTMVMI